MVRPFASFQVHAGNQLAYAAVLSLARRSRPEIHPLVLHGPSGCGKSHLLKALSQAAREAGILPLLFADAGRLSRRIALTAREGRLPEFRVRFRGLRLLILDGGEALSGKVRTQTELLHALDTLGAGDGNAVIALRESPGAMKGLSEGLSSRLLGGLVVEISMQHAVDYGVKEIPTSAR